MTPGGCSRAASTRVNSHSSKILRRLERDIFPWPGARPIASITAPELLTALRRIESRGALETAHRAMQNCSPGLPLRRRHRPRRA
jgi:integrase